MVVQFYVSVFSKHAVSVRSVDYLPYYFVYDATKVTQHLLYSRPNIGCQSDAVH